MPLPIIEDPMLGQMTLETTAWASSFTWVDRTSDLVDGVSYAVGGRVGFPGTSSVDVGTLTASFKNLVSPPLVGDLVRVRRTATTQYVFVGYVQDVSQTVIFNDSISYNTPVVLTTITCVDWVGYVGQFQVSGVGGLSSLFVTQSNYPFQSRVRALNNVMVGTNNTQIISSTADVLPSNIGDTDYQGTVAEHLDLVANTQNLFWYANLTVPTNKTTGRANLVSIRPLTAAISSGKTFTDVAGSAGQLHYVEIDLESSSQNIANDFLLNNYSLITTTEPEVTRIGGANRANYGVVNGEEIVSVPWRTSWAQSDSTSKDVYGNRASDIETNLAGLVEDLNLVGNPSMEYGDDGWNTGANRMARREPPFAQPYGKWALRYRLASGGASSPSFRYSGSENDGIPVLESVSYMLQIGGARATGTTTDTRMRVYIEWQDNAGATISTTRGSFVSVPNVQQWYLASHAATAPVGTERAIIGLEFSRSGGGTYNTGSVFWLDGALMRKSSSSTPITYFDGDTNASAASIYVWTGEVGLSPSFKMTNQLDDLATTYLARYANTSNRITRIRWNVQEDITAVASMHVGSTIQVIFKGTTTTHRIVGIDGNITTERYMIDYYLEKV